MFPVIILRVLFVRYNYSDQVKEDEMRRICSSHGEKSTCRISMGKLEGKRQLGRPRRKWKHNI
jgi:hypothetical protein